MKISKILTLLGFILSGYLAEAQEVVIVDPIGYGAEVEQLETDSKTMISCKSNLGELTLSTFLEIRFVNEQKKEFKLNAVWPIPSVSKVSGTAFGDSGSVDVKNYFTYEFAAIQESEIPVPDADQGGDAYNEWLYSLKKTMVKVTEESKESVGINLVVDNQFVGFSDCKVHILPSSVYSYPKN